MLDVSLFHFTLEGRPSPAEVARLAEDGGLDGVYVPEHTHFPVAGTGFADPDGAPLDESYRRLFDPFVTLAAMAGATESIRLGTAVCQLTYRDPIVTAKAVATLDHVSSGRVVFGVGTGWHHEQGANHGIHSADGAAILAGKLRVVRSLWTDEIATSTVPGAILTPSWQWPKPVQRPHPPVLLGGDGPSVLDRVLDLGVGWLPTYRGGPIAPRVRALVARAAALGAPPIRVEAVVKSIDLHEWAALVEAGVHGVIVRSPADDPVGIAAFVERCTTTRQSLE